MKEMKRVLIPKCLKPSLPRRMTVCAALAWTWSFNFLLFSSPSLDASGLHASTCSCASVLPDTTADSDHGAFIRLDEATVEVFQRDVMTFSEITRHTVIHILNEKGFRYANVVIPYDGDSKVSKIQARTILPGGTIVPLDKHQIFDTSLYPDYVFYSDMRARRFTMPAVETGSILEYRWTKTTNNFTFWTRWAFQQDDPVGVSRITIRCPDMWDIQWKTYGTDIQPRLENVLKGSKADHVWQLEKVPAFRPEPGMPSGNDQVISILFSPVGVKTWNDITLWFRNISRKPFSPDAAIKAQAAMLTANARTDRDKLRSIYEFVRDHIRYVAIEIGIGGYQAHAAGQVLENRYGDCKDMVALISALSESAGLRSEPVLLSTWHYGELDTALVSLVHFNHLIARCLLQDGSEIWMDATDKTMPFGSLPWYDSDRTVVSVPAEGGACILRTPGARAADHGIERRWKASVDSAGLAAGTLDIVLKGALAGDMRHFSNRTGREELNDWFGGEMLARFPFGDWEQVRILDKDSLDKPLRIHGAFSGAKWFYSNANGYGFQPGALSSFGWNRLFPGKNRTSPLKLEYPLHVMDEAEIAFPERWRTIRNSGRDTLGGDFGAFSAFWKAEGNTLHYRRCFKIDSAGIGSSDYADFRDFVNSVAAVDRKTVVFTR